MSGQVAGAEYPLTPGDTVFVVGAQHQLWDGTGEGYAAAENVVFIPDAACTASFVVRVDPARSHTSDTPLQVAVKSAPDQPLVFEPLPLQQPQAVGPYWLAAAAQEAPWSPAVLEFVPPKDVVVARAHASARPTRRMVGGGILALLLVLGIAAVWQFGLLHRDADAASAASLQETLHGGPESFTVLPGRDNRLYVFSVHPENMLWAMRALHGVSHEQQAMFVTLQGETERVGRLLEAAGQSAAIVTLTQPQRPQVHVVAHGESASAVAESVRALLMNAMPYAEDVTVSSIDERTLARKAQAELGALGISSRVITVADHVSVMNDVVLADADLASMVSYRKRFTRQWGERLVSIRIELWDDLTKGQSYEYGPQQLLTTDKGRWTFLSQVSPGN